MVHYRLLLEGVLCEKAFGRLFEVSLVSHAWNRNPLELTRAICMLACIGFEYGRNACKAIDLVCQNNDVTDCIVMMRLVFVLSTVVTPIVRFLIANSRLIRHGQLISALI